MHSLTTLIVSIYINLLHSFLNKIVGHRDLVFKAKIPHRDISSNNLMLFGFPAQFSIQLGLLIDLDYVLDLDDERRLGLKPPLLLQNSKKCMKKQMAAVTNKDKERGQCMVGIIAIN